MSASVVTSPLRAVLAALRGGAGTLGEVARQCELDRDLVEAAVAHLVRIGAVPARELALGCPGGGCSSCASGVDGAPGCGSAGPEPDSVAGTSTPPPHSTLRRSEAST